MDIEPIQPLGPTVWPKIVRRRDGDEESGRRHGAEDEPEPEEPFEDGADDDGQPHIDVRV